jgi:signal peptide peptidase SppA
VGESHLEVTETTIPTGTWTNTSTFLPPVAAEEIPAWDTQALGEFLLVAGRPWALKPEAMELLVAAVQTGITQGPALASIPESQTEESPRGVAVIPLGGMITPAGVGGPLGQMLGLGGGLDEFRSSLRRALADEDVGHIVLNVNSPGGLVDQVPETAAMIREAREVKPITAVASTQAASAAYWLASQADELVVTPSGEVGSVGAYIMHADMSGKLASEGINVSLVSAGRYKTDGNKFQPLTDTAREAMQRKVNKVYGMFVADVARGRKVADAEVGLGFGEGRTMLAEDAITYGLADRIATLDQTIGTKLGISADEAAKTRLRDIERRREALVLDVI